MLCRFLLIIIALFLTACSSINPPLKSSVQSANNLQAAGLNVQLGVDYLQQGQADLAKPKLLLALQQAPNWPPALNAMAYFLEKTGDSPGAEQYYQQALRINPKEGNANNNYGTFLCRSKRYSEATAHFELAVKDPAYLNAANAYENAGLCAVEAGNLVAAQHYFEQALLQNSTSLQSLLGLAQLAYHRQDYSLAHHYLLSYQKAGGIDPDAQMLADTIAEKLRNNDKLAGGMH